MPDQPLLPPYTYIPGRNPHPVSHPDGHRQGAPEGELRVELAHDQWLACAVCERGFQLFEAGYYWEAHEVWEALWKRLPEQSAQRQLVQGWIKLAAAGVKCLEGNRNGAVRHAARSAELLAAVGGDHSASPRLQELGKRWKKVALRIQQSPPAQADSGDGRSPRPLPGFTTEVTG